MLCWAQPLSRVQLFVTPWTAARQAPLSVRILQARMLGWAAMSSPPGDLSYSRIKPGSPALHVDSVPAELPRKPPKWGSVQFSSVAQSCPTLRDPMNYSTPGLPVHHQLLELTQIHVYRVGDAI